MNLGSDGVSRPRNCELKHIAQKDNLNLCETWRNRNLPLADGMQMGYTVNRIKMEGCRL